MRDLVVLGHSECAGIRAACAAAEGAEIDAGHEREFIGDWVGIAGLAVAASAAPGRADNHAVEQASVAQSIRNLATYPWIAEAVAGGRLTLHGWWFEMKAGVLWSLEGDRFTPLAGAPG
ncbi:MAG: carbonic anhydrase [Pseudomonadota bacterium]